MPVHTCVTECARNGGYICHWVHPFLRIGGVYLPCIFRTPGGVTVGDSGLCLLCPLSVERYISPSFVDSARNGFALKGSPRTHLHVVGMLKFMFLT